MRYCFLFHREMQEDCGDSLEEPPSRHRYLPATSPTSPIREAHMEHLERCVILMYDTTSNKTNANEAGSNCFQGKAEHMMLSIPPKRSALLQHTNRAAYQAGHCWSQALSPSLDLHSQGDVEMDFQRGRMAAFLDDASRCEQSCKELLRCRCKCWFRGGCSCTRVVLRCTAL